MNFARTLIEHESVATRSGIRKLPLPPEGDIDAALDRQVVAAANAAAKDLLLGPDALVDDSQLDARRYPDRLVEESSVIQSGDLVVVQEAFDKLDFVYATEGGEFQNRNGLFRHNDFIGKPFGSKIRSANHRGYGFVYLLRPTPELWCRSLNHRTQIVHELDQAQVVFQLQLRPNMTVIESGTGSGAMSHAILRTIAPHGHLHTFEFNQMRVEAAREEFRKNGVDHLVDVYHRDVCGRDGSGGGFALPESSVDAAFLDLPEPWLAIEHARHVLKVNARVATYSPCVEQTQRTVAALEEAGFHSIKTFEYRLQEHYVDEVDYEPPPSAKRPKSEPHIHNPESGEDTGAEADNEKSENEAIEEPQAANGKRKRMVVARPFVMMRGHTAFLTFAKAGNKPKAAGEKTGT